ncbi:FAD-binding oxidoreductase [Neosynechococcus sphagnicola]|uniref:FAD-binding oxidoreductase n=1 Tax=Neosynechococcus sphagnicola TaxID=1501145 RepID=UPI000A92822E|nr:FAD-binding oxidoreductase [Neosynechococcus sphagnicola]
MLEEIRQIQNPLVRSVTAASAAFAMATIVSGAAVGLVNPQDRAMVGVYASLIGSGCGAIAGVVSGKKGSKTEPITGGNLSQAPTQPRTEGKTWQDWRNFVVMRKVKESEEITSFYLQPEDRGVIPNFQPGQFLTIKLEIPGRPQPVIRTYSLSDYPEPCEYYRLSIKRELAPKGLEVPPGAASNFMHDQIQVGSIIPAKPPSGKFVLNVQQSNPVVLISNGVGITPMISMARACSRLNPQRQIWFLHGARDGQYHAFRDQVMAVAQQNANLHLHFAYSRPRPEDAGFYHSMGYVDTALVESLVSKDAEFFLCGSPPVFAIADGGA